MTPEQIYERVRQLAPSAAFTVSRELDPYEAERKLGPP